MKGKVYFFCETSVKIQKRRFRAAAFQFKMAKKDVCQATSPALHAEWAHFGHGGYMQRRFVPLSRFVHCSCPDNFRRIRSMFQRLGPSMAKTDKFHIARGAPNMRYSLRPTECSRSFFARAGQAQLYLRNTVPNGNSVPRIAA